MNIIAKAQTRGGKYVKTVEATDVQLMNGLFDVVDRVNSQVQARCCNIRGKTLALATYGKQIKNEKLYDSRNYHAVI